MVARAHHYGWLGAFFICVRCATAADYYVDPNLNGAYPTIQRAVDAVSGQSELARANIFIAPGIYSEAVVIDKPFVSLIGQGDSREATRISQARLPIDGAASDAGEVLSVRAGATGFMARNLAVENTTPAKLETGALAIRSSADRVIFDHVGVYGYHDTLYLDGMARQYFRDCFISGSVDFIFGDATAVFEHCQIESTYPGDITAANTRRATANGLVFLDCSLVAGVDRDPNLDGLTPLWDGSVFLGRPWMWYDQSVMPSVAFIRTAMGPHIAYAGWDPWNDTGIPEVDPTLDRAPRTRVSEFDSTDPAGTFFDRDFDGVTPNGRVAWADRMNSEQAANYTLTNIFGPADFWNATTQPDAGGVQYASQGAPWNPVAQLGTLPAARPLRAHALNMSTRVRVSSGDNAMIAGLIVRGAVAAKDVLIRALGPSLGDVGLSDTLADPLLTLTHADGTSLRFNNDWQTGLPAGILTSGLAPANNRESAVRIKLIPGAYTATVRGRNRTSGVAMAEIYDLDPDGDSDLANISTRGFVDRTGDGPLIGGFILGGGTLDAHVIVRALGPSLLQSGVAGALADPVLELRGADGTLIARNDNWKDTQRAEILAACLAPGDEREAAISALLPAGNYTAVVSGNGDGGIALVEVYNLQ